MTVATSEDRINTHKTLQPPSHTRDLGGQRDLLTAHGNLFHGPPTALGHADQSALLGEELSTAATAHLASSTEYLQTGK